MIWMVPASRAYGRWSSAGPPSACHSADESGHGRSDGIEGQHPAGTVTTASQVLDFNDRCFQASDMRLPWQAQEYVRTCVECGYAWRVPRLARRRRIRSISMFSVAPRGRTIDRGELGREVDAISAEGQATATFRRCPKCGADHFAQSPSRGTLP